VEVKDLISSRVSLAPMAGITDYILRLYEKAQG
jgi:tRNA-dihydrouridine synthase